MKLTPAEDKEGDCKLEVSAILQVVNSEPEEVDSDPYVLKLPPEMDSMMVSYYSNK